MKERAVSDRRAACRGTPDRRRGRPRLFDGTPVSLRLPATLHDEMSREALRRDCPLADVMRERLWRISEIDKPHA